MNENIDTTGTPGLPGKDKIDGLKGDTGERGIDSNSHIYISSTNTCIPGNFNINHDHLSFATILTINVKNINNLDITPWLKSIEMSDTIIITDKNDINNFGVYKVDSDRFDLFNYENENSNDVKYYPINFKYGGKDIYFCINKIYVISYEKRGEKGDKGDRGPIGIQGKIGPIGFTGDKGDTGNTGSTGKTGPIGFTGAIGLQGLRGNTGYTGRSLALIHSSLRHPPLRLSN